jgi:hypothetical protein
MDLYQKAQELEEGIFNRKDPKTGMPKPVDKLTNQDMAELTTTLDTMFKRGTSTVAGQKKLFPESMQSEVARLTQFFTGEPEEVANKEFVKKYMETVKRLKLVSAQNILKSQDIATEGFSHLKKEDPARFERILQKAKIPTESDVKEIEKEVPLGGPAPASAPGNMQPPPNMSFEEFKKWKAMNGK